MAKGDTYNNSTNIRMNGTTQNIQPSGSEELCLYMATCGGTASNVTVETATIQSSGNYVYPYAFAYQLHGQFSQSTNNITMPFRLTLDNTNYIIIEGQNASSWYAAYWLSGIYLA